MKTEELMKDTMIKDWFATISAKEATRVRYSEAMHYFTDMTKKTPLQLIEEAESEIREGKVMRMRQVRRYLLGVTEK